MQCDLMMRVCQKSDVDLTLVLSMCWRVLESINWSCGRLAFEIVDISCVLYAMLRNAVDFMDGVNWKQLIWL